jgi:hypothetical protein
MVGCSMAAEGYSAEYATLAKYAAEKGIPVGYLRGVVHYLGLPLTICAGSQIVDREARAKLDPVVGKIKASIASAERDRPIRGGRRRLASSA